MIDPDDPIPSGERIADAERRARFTTRRIAPPASPDFAVRLLVPNGWEPLALPGSDQPVGVERVTHLGGFHDPATHDAPPLFTLGATGLLRDLTAKHFLMAYAMEAGLEPLALEELSDEAAAAILVQEIKGVPFVHRTLMRFDGPRAFVASGLAPRRLYASLADTFAVMVSTLEIESPSPDRFIEPRVPRALLDRVAFEAPASFRALEAPGGTATHRALDLYHEDPSGRFSGLIRVDLDLGRRAPEYAEEMTFVLAHLAERGVEVAPEPTDIPIDEGDERLRTLALQRLPGREASGLPMEVWIGLIRVDGCPLRIWLLGPSRKIDFVHWAVNERAFRVVLESLRAS